MSDFLNAHVNVACQPNLFGSGNVETIESNPRGSFTIRVRLISGSETSRLFQSSSTRNITGESVTLYGVTESELISGKITRVMM